MKIKICLIIMSIFNTVNTQFDNNLNYNQAVQTVQNNIYYYNNDQNTHLRNHRIVNVHTLQYTANQSPIVQTQITITSKVQNRNVLNSNQINPYAISYETIQPSSNKNPSAQNQFTLSNNAPNAQIAINTKQRNNPLIEQYKFTPYNTNRKSQNPTNVQQSQGKALDRSSSVNFINSQQFSGKQVPSNRNVLSSNTPTFESKRGGEKSSESFQYKYSKGWSVHEALSADDIVRPQVEYHKYLKYSKPNTPEAQYYQKFYNIYNDVENQGRQDLTQYEMESVNDDFNGRSIVAPGQYPHMAAIGFLSNEDKIEYKCGGSLISASFVVTAAHCCYLSGESPIIAKFGIINLKAQTGNSIPQRRIITEIIVHPSYNASMTYHDIALLKLQKPVEFTKFVHPILLWSRDDIPYERVFTMGYGSTKFSKAPTNILTELSLSLIPLQKCKQILPADEKTPYGIVETQICGRDLERNRDTCQGDSGGPLQLNLEHRKQRNTYHYYLVGIISYGEFCGSKKPGVYTRVSSYCKWIASIVWPDYFKSFR